MPPMVVVDSAVTIQATAVIPTNVTIDEHTARPVRVTAADPANAASHSAARGALATAMVVGTTPTTATTARNTIKATRIRPRPRSLIRGSRNPGSVPSGRSASIAT